MSNSLRLHGLWNMFPCLSLSPGVCSNSCPLSRWCYLTISSSAAPFSFCLQSFPAPGSFPVSWLFTLGGQSIGASASVHAKNIQGWFPVGLIGLNSLQSKRLSGVFSCTTSQRHQFLVFSFLCGPALISVHDYWENHSFDLTGLCQKSDGLTF